MLPLFVYTSITIYFSYFCLLLLMLEQEIMDTSNGCGENYAVIIVSEQFEGKMTLARHRLSKIPAFPASCEYGPSAGRVIDHSTCGGRGVATRYGAV